MAWPPVPSSLWRCVLPETGNRRLSTVVAPLLTSQSHHRIDLRRPPGGDICGQ